MKEDVVGWLSKCESYFGLDKTPEESRVTMTSLVLDEAGYQWFDGLKKSSQDLITWQIFSQGIRIRFNDTLQRPLEELVQLKQRGTFSEYKEKFERISCRSNLSEEQKLDCYLGGLKEELAWDVRLFNPRMVLEATRVAKIKEMSLRSISKGGLTRNETKKGAMLANQNQGTSQDQRGILGKPGYKFQSKLSPEKVEEHRNKNLCFFCHERFTPGHNCLQRQKGQVFLMESEDPFPVQGMEVEENSGTELDGEQQQAAVPLNTILGNVGSGTGTMRVKGTVGSRTIHILLDTESSHNFLSEKFSKVSPTSVIDMQPLQVTVANGGRVQGTRMIKGFTWAMQGHQFSTDVILFPLVGCDVILGMHWLKTLGAITWDCYAIYQKWAKD